MTLAQKLLSRRVLTRMALALPLAGTVIVPIGDVLAQATGTPAATATAATKAGSTGGETPLLAKLPDEYVGRDTNRDGQIGLYEWSRKDLATFRRLDSNRDGFLTAQELIASKQPSRIFSSNVYVPTSKATAANVAGAKSGSTPAVAATDNKAAAKIFKSVGNSTDVANDLIARAKRAFGDLDKDKDGLVSKEELTKSRVFGKRFNEAGIAIAEPVSLEKFTTLFTQVMGRDA